MKSACRMASAAIVSVGLQAPPDAAEYAALIQTTTLLNRVGAELAADPAVHGMTDVTGFGLLGHALEMARGSQLTLSIEAKAISILPAAEQLAAACFYCGFRGSLCETVLENTTACGSPRLTKKVRRYSAKTPGTLTGTLANFRSKTHAISNG